MQCITVRYTAYLFVLRASHAVCRLIILDARYAHRFYGMHALFAVTLSLTKGVSFRASESPLYFDAVSYFFLSRPNFSDVGEPSFSKLCHSVWILLESQLETEVWCSLPVVQRKITANIR